MAEAADQHFFRPPLLPSLLCAFAALRETALNVIEIELAQLRQLLLFGRDTGAKNGRATSLVTAAHLGLRRDAHPIRAGLVRVGEGGTLLPRVQGARLLLRVHGRNALLWWDGEGAKALQAGFSGRRP